LNKIELANNLEQIKAELIFDIAYLKEIIANNQTYIEYLDKVREGKYDEINLSNLLDALTRNLNTKSCGFSFKKLMESGNAEYITDSETSDMLQDYYLTSCPVYNDRATYHAMFISQNIEGPLLLILNHKKDFLVDPKEVIEQLENGKLKSLLNWQLSFLLYVIPAIEENINQAEELIRLISHK